MRRALNLFKSQVLRAGYFPPPFGKTYEMYIVQSVERQVALTNVKWLTQYLSHCAAKMDDFFHSQVFNMIAHAKFQLVLSD